MSRSSVLKTGHLLSRSTDRSIANLVFPSTSDFRQTKLSPSRVHVQSQQTSFPSMSFNKGFTGLYCFGIDICQDEKECVAVSFKENCNRVPSGDHSKFEGIEGKAATACASEP